MMKTDARVAIVTGGGQGIGKAIVLRLLNEGMRVIIAEIDEEAGLETALEFGDTTQVRYIRTDVSDEQQVQEMVESAVQSWGRLDVLVNNAGIAQAHGPSVKELKLEVWNRVLSVNLTGMFLCAKHAAPYLEEQKGSIVNISSTRAMMSEGNTEAYSASKGGVVALTHALAVSLGPHVRVNCISPGWIDVSGWKKSSIRKTVVHSTEDHNQHPAGRVGKPEDISSLVSYLISHEAAFITGADFVVDGGMTRKMQYI